MSIFEEASRGKIQFKTVRGTNGLEDMWDIPLESNDGFNLDEIAKAIYIEVKKASTESFVNKGSKVSKELELKFAVIKRIIEVKLAERAKAVDDKKIEARRMKIAELIEQKENEDLEGMSKEDLLKELD